MAAVTSEADLPAVPPLIMTVRARYHAPLEDGTAACDRDLALNLSGRMWLLHVPSGLRCPEVKCRRRWLDLLEGDDT